MLSVDSVHSIQKCIFSKNLINVQHIKCRISISKAHRARSSSTRCWTSSGKRLRDATASRVSRQSHTDSCMSGTTLFIRVLSRHKTHLPNDHSSISPDVPERDSLSDCSRLLTKASLSETLASFSEKLGTVVRRSCSADRCNAAIIRDTEAFAYISC